MIVGAIGVLLCGVVAGAAKCHEAVGLHLAHVYIEFEGRAGGGYKFCVNKICTIRVYYNVYKKIVRPNFLLVLNFGQIGGSGFKNSNTPSRVDFFEIILKGKD